MVPFETLMFEADICAFKGEEANTRNPPIYIYPIWINVLMVLREKPKFFKLRHIDMSCILANYQ